MNRKITVIAAILALSGCGGDLYESDGTYKEPEGSDIFLMPYYSHVDSHILVAIQKPASGASPKDNEASGSTATGAPAGNLTAYSLTVSVVNVPSKQRYLYFKNRSLYSSSVEFTTNLVGQPSKSDTSSQQMLTSALSEIGQTIGELASAASKFGGFAAVKNPPSNGLLTESELPRECAKRLSELVPTFKIIDVPTLTEKEGDTSTSLNRISEEPIEDEIIEKSSTKPDGVKRRVSDILTIYLKIEGGAPPDPYALLRQGDKNQNPDRATTNGFWVYDPLPVAITPMCGSQAYPDGVAIGAMQIFTVYRYAHAVNPQRKFWTNPQDTYTLSDGIITGHKFTDQSALKTAVDLITSPIRSALPSAQTTTSVQVQSGGGKPDQTTTSTSTQVSGPKQ